MSLNSHTFADALSAFPTLEKNVVLVALSGGIDSVVLCDLLSKCDVHFSVAHMNFNLRGEESIRDEMFSESISKKYNVPFHIKRISVEHETLIPGKSTQEAARILRYQWFEELMTQHGIPHVMTAHHKDDQAETIIYQFIRGGTIAALRGMKNIHGRLLRPLLAFTREEIREYARTNELAWKEDSSNAKVKYARNYIRHEILPRLVGMNPGIVDSISKRAAIFEEAEQLVDQVISNDLQNHLNQRDKNVSLDVEWLSNYPYRRLILWKWIEPFHFTSGQVDEALNLLKSTPGARIESATHEIWKETGKLVLTEKRNRRDVKIWVEKLPFSLQNAAEIDLSECSVDEVRFEKNQSVMFLDLDKIIFPLLIRSWKEGDKFRPLGMKGQQLVSDLLIQNKIPVRQKPDVMVIESEGVIAAVAGLRVDDRFKLGEDSRRVLRIACSMHL